MITAGFLEVPAIGNEPATSAEIFLFPETKRRKKLRSFGPSVTIGPEAAKRNHGSELPTASRSIDLMPLMGPVARTSLRLKLRSAGYSPIPVEGKRAVANAWEQKHHSNDDEIELWSRVYDRAHNTGVLTKFVPTIDIDIMHPEAAEAIEALAREHFEEHGDILVRIGKAPKRAIMLRTDEPFSKLTRGFAWPNGSGQIEVLADGQQVVAFGVHPDTKQPYRWHGGEPGAVNREDLPYVRQGDIEKFLDAASALLVEQFGFTSKGGSKPKAGNGEAAPHDPVDWGVSSARILAGESPLHDSIRDLAASFIASGMSEKAAIERLRSLMTAGTATKDGRWREYYDDIPRAVRTARKKFEPEESSGDAKKEKPAGLEDRVALEFAKLRADDFRFVATWNRWMKYDGTRWQAEDTLCAFDEARKLCRQARNAKAKTVAAVVTLARTDRRLAAVTDQWDADLWLLGTPAGAIDLRTAKTRPASPDDYITKITTVAPGGGCPLWLKFLTRVTGNDPESQNYLQRVCGYALTGDTSEDALFFLYGTGANGKSVFLKTIAGILGDHHKTASMETFTVTNSERHPTDPARGIQPTLRCCAALGS
jgi:hypothetical protein